MEITLRRAKKSARRHGGSNQQRQGGPCGLPDTNYNQDFWRAYKRRSNKNTSNHQLERGLFQGQPYQGTPRTPGTDNGCGGLPGTNRAHVRSPVQPR